MLLAQVVESGGYRGRTVRLGASLSAVDARSVCLAAYLLDDRAEQVGAPARSEALTGTFDWRQAEVTFAVPPAAAAIVFGIEVEGSCTARVADARFEVVDGPAEPGEEPRPPRNLDFSQGT